MQKEFTSHLVYDFDDEVYEVFPEDFDWQDAQQQMFQYSNKVWDYEDDCWIDAN